MKRIELLPSLVLLISVVLFAPAVSASGFDARVFIDSGKLYGVSEEALLIHDLATGELTIDYAEGELFRGSASNRTGNERRGGAKNPMLYGTFWLGADADDGTGTSLSTAGCSAKAAAVQSAVSTVQSACADGPSASCTSAITALQDAQDVYAECLGNFLEQY